MAEFDPEARMIAGPQFDKIYCPSCNSPNPVGSKFCVHCSSYLDELEGDAKDDVAGGEEDALDSLLARQREEATEPEQVTPMPPDPGAELPAPISSPGASVASAAPQAQSQAPASAAPPPSSAPPEGDDPDVLPQPVHLADGRVITRRSTLAKLEKLQQILGDQGPLTGATKGKSEEVLALEVKVAEQAKEIEKLTAEKEEIVQAYMADALSDEGPEAADAQATLDEAHARVSRAEAEAARLSRAEADMHKEMRDLMAKLQEAQAETEQFKARLMEQPDPLGGGGDPQALAVAEARVQQLEASLQQAMSQGQALQARVQELEGKLTQTQENANAAQEGSQKMLEGQLQEQAEALAQARAALSERDQEAQALRNQLETAQADGAGGAQLETLRAQLAQVQAAAKDQVRVVTRYYERILGHVPCGVVVLAEGGVILSVNPAVTALLGIPTPELLRKHLEQVPALQPLVQVAAQLDQQPPNQDLPAQAIELPCAVGEISVKVSAAHGELGSRSVKILVLDPPSGEGGASGDSDIQGLREDLFGLRMMIELLGSKADKPQVVTEVTRDLLGDLDRILAQLQ